MTQSGKLVDLVQDKIQEFLQVRGSILASIGDDALPLERFSRDFLRFGKRYRALFCYWGWQSVQGFDPTEDPFAESRRSDVHAVVSAAAGLELFHAAALVHDDLMDDSDTRRGMPSAHRHFEADHRDHAWVGDAERFGRSAALLLGDLLLCWADELFAEGLDLVHDRDSGVAARVEYNRMRTDVTAGQYLDIAAEAAWPDVPDHLAIETATRVLVYKSAKYSIEAPLAIGGSLGGASMQQLACLRAFGLPLGIAFQLRDDLLGVFGDSDVTGKPAGDDLREGKRTVLIALTRQALPVSARRTLDELLGDPELDGEQIETLQRTIQESGAVLQVERMIAEHVEQALVVLDDAPLTSDARHALTGLADSVSVRTA